MKKLLSTKYSAGAFNTAILLLRLVSGGLIMSHGYDKLVHFGERKADFMNFMGLGSTTSLALVVFAEFFCGLFIVIGLFTRLAAIPLIITMLVIISKVTNFDVWGKGEMATLYFGAFLTLLFLGAGKVSIDNMIAK